METLAHSLFLNVPDMLRGSPYRIAAMVYGLGLKGDAREHYVTQSRGQ